MTSEKYVLFIESNTTGTGIQALARAHLLGMIPVLFTRDRTLYPALETTNYQVVSCETNDIASVCAAVEQFRQTRSGTIEGITTTSEFYIEIAAALATTLGLPTNAPETLRTCRNKFYTRQALSDLGYLQPKWIALRNVADIEAAVVQVGLPCVIKPCDNTGSYGVKLCCSIDEALEHAKNLLQYKVNVRGQATERIILCEEYIDAPEFSVETFACSGSIHCIGITQKDLVGFPYFTEKKHIFPAPLPPEIHNAVESTTVEALKAIGSTHGPMHIEVKLTSRGCVIIEINARLAGDMIPELIFQAKGIDMLENQLREVCGQVPALSARCSGYAGILFFTAPIEGTFKGINHLDELSRRRDVVQIRITAPIGKHVHPPQNSFDRLGYVILQTDTYEESIERLEKIQQETEILIEPDNKFSNSPAQQAFEVLGGNDPK